MWVLKEGGGVFQKHPSWAVVIVVWRRTYQKLLQHSLSLSLTGRLFVDS